MGSIKRVPWQISLPGNPLYALSFLSPHKTYTRTGGKIPRTPTSPTSTVSIPVPVGCVDCTVRVNLFYDGHVTVATCTLHIRLQDHNPRNVTRSGHNPPTSPPRPSPPP